MSGFTSIISRLLRRLADAVDTRSARAPRYRREIDIFSLSLLFAGIVVLGVLIHGVAFWLWVSLFALVLCTCVSILFIASRWVESRRLLLLFAVLLLSIRAASEYLVALFIFIALFYTLLSALWKKESAGLYRELPNVLAAFLVCFTLYGFFSGIIESLRSSYLRIEESVALDCQEAQSERTCRARETVFSIPEFWRGGRASSLVNDLTKIMPLETFIDSATQNTVAFAAFKVPPAQVTAAMQKFFSSQKSFLSSRAAQGNPLLPRVIMKNNDSLLTALSYERIKQPAYLAEKEESSALFLLLSHRQVTWLFIIDGTQAEGREFLLHRIVTGFR